MSLTGSGSDYEEKITIIKNKLLSKEVPVAAIKFGDHLDSEGFGSVAKCSINKNLVPENFPVHSLIKSEGQKFLNDQVCKTMSYKTKKQRYDIYREMDFLNTLYHKNLPSIKFYSEKSEDDVMKRYQAANSSSRKKEMAEIYMITENLGRNLRVHLDEKGMDALEILSVALNTAEALTYVHDLSSARNKCIHRDVKPANIMLKDMRKTSAGAGSKPVSNALSPSDSRTSSTCLSNRGRSQIERNSGDPFDMKLIDFGLARETQHKVSAKICSPPYASPEQLLDGLITTKSDIFSFCSTLWFMIHYRQGFKSPFPFKHLKIMDKLSDRKNERPLIHKDVPKEIKQLMVACWEYDSSKRPSARAVASKLMQFQSDKKLVEKFDKALKKMTQTDSEKALTSSSSITLVPKYVKYYSKKSNLWTRFVNRPKKELLMIVIFACSLFVIFVGIPVGVFLKQAFEEENEKDSENTTMVYTTTIGSTTIGSTTPTGISGEFQQRTYIGHSWLIQNQVDLENICFFRSTKNIYQQSVTISIYADLSCTIDPSNNPDDYWKYNYEFLNQRGNIYIIKSLYTTANTPQFDLYVKNYSEKRLSLYYIDIYGKQTAYGAYELNKYL